MKAALMLVLAVIGEVESFRFGGRLVSQAPSAAWTRSNWNTRRTTAVRISPEDLQFIMNAEKEGKPGEAGVQEGFIPTPFDADKINPESFQGFLKDEFIGLVQGDPKTAECTFKQFFNWKSRMGLVFTEEEIKELWVEVHSSERPITLKEFIDFTIRIDESPLQELL